MPSVFERRDLRFAVAARLVPKQHVVVSVGIERRVEIDQIDRLILDVVAKDLQIVAVVEGVHKRSRIYR